MEVDMEENAEIENNTEEVKAVINNVNAGFESEQMKAKEKKRTRRDSSKRESHNSTSSNGNGYSNGTGNGISNGAIKLKNGKTGDRKSRSLYGRGLPKKGGGGGKGTWGKPGEEIYDGGVLDNHDPNYDSEEDEQVSYKAITPEWSEDEIIKILEPILLEYFEHGQKNEVLDSLREVNMSHHRYLPIVVLITLAMEKKNEFREMASQLLNVLVKAVPIIGPSVLITNGDVFYATTTDLGKALLILLENLPELVLDTPDAHQVLGKFIARLIAQKTIGASVLEDLKARAEEMGEDSMKKCEKEARLLLSIPHYQFDNIWGAGGGNQPVVLLKKKMTMLLKEYLSSGDSEEAIRCLTELDVPHFHHEVVYEAVVMLIEISTERASNMMSFLIKRLTDSMIVTEEQLNHGMRRVYTNMPDINLDVPNAYHILEKFVNKLHDLKVIGNKLKVEAPNKSRKRYVSESDCGRVRSFRNDRYFDLV